jgi:predicted phosphoribosyltransferase
MMVSKEFTMMTAQRFADRAEAGRALAGLLGEWAGRADAVVLALPRGGVPVAYEVARALRLPLDLLLVRKLGVPGHEELAMGAIASGGEPVMHRETVDALGIPLAAVERVVEMERQELARRERQYREGRPAPEVTGRTVLLVDDGLATGSTMQAAALAVRAAGAARIIVAVPTASAEACELLRGTADRVIAAMTPEPFYAVGAWYADFSQTSDEEVRTLLAQAASSPGG